jgi:hypothetical protein
VNPTIIAPIVIGFAIGIGYFLGRRRTAELSRQIDHLRDNFTRSHNDLSRITNKHDALIGQDRREFNHWDIITPTGTLHDRVQALEEHDALLRRYLHIERRTTPQTSAFVRIKKARPS